MPNGTEGVLHKSIHGGMWLTAGYVVQKCIGLGSFFILARLLTPAEFGTMAIILIAPKFLESVTDTGFGTALIQKTEHIEQYLNPTWTLRLLKAIVLALLIAAFSPLIAPFFNSETALLAIALSGVFIVIQGFSNIGETYFFKNMDFKKLFWRNVIRESAFVAAALVAITVTRSYWALFAANLAAYAAQASSTYILSSYRPRLSFAFRPLLELVPYSKWIVGQRFLMQAYILLENATVARLTSASAVGLYSKAKSLGALIPVFLSSTLCIVSFPAYAKLQEEKDKVTDGFAKSMDVLFFFTVPVLALIFAGGGKLIAILLGENWLPMLPALQLLTLFFALNSINELAASVFNATGSPKKQTSHSAVRFLATALTIIPLTTAYGIVGAACSLLIGGAVLFVLNFWSLRRMSLVSAATLVRTLSLPLILSLVLWGTVTLWRESIIGLGVAPFIALVLLGAAAYLLITYLVGRWCNVGPYRTLRLIATSIVKR